MASPKHNPLQVAEIQAKYDAQTHRREALIVALEKHSALFEGSMDVDTSSFEQGSKDLAPLMKHLHFKLTEVGELKGAVSGLVADT